MWFRFHPLKFSLPLIGQRESLDQGGSRNFLSDKILAITHLVLFWNYLQ